MLQHYEILDCEQLHDVKHHIENMYAELPHHLNKAEKKLMEDYSIITWTQRNKKRNRLPQNFNKIKHFTERENWHLKILSSLCNIQDILYAGEMKRTVENILRLHNQMFLHACLIKELVGSKAKSLTDQMLWGNTSMQLFVMHHLCTGLLQKKQQMQNKKNVFSTPWKISNTTSNQHPEHVLLNNMIRMQVREEMNLSKLTKQQHEVRKLCHSLQEKCNTIIPFWVIDKYAREWQAHLELVADYITEDCWWTETDDGIMFLDCGKNENSEYKPHHFRSWNKKTELRYLKRCWEKCLIKPQSIPAKEIKIEDSEGQLSTMKFNIYHMFFKHHGRKRGVISSTGAAVTEKITNKKANHFRTYNPRKWVCNREEQNIDTDILTSNIAVWW